MISPDEKLNRIDREYPGIMEIIWYLSNNISKLNREFIDKSLGNRTSIEQFAEIEKIPVDDLIDYLYISTGHISELSENKAQGKSNFRVSDKKPGILENLPEDKLIKVDVREDILSGVDPINKIKNAISQLNEGNAVHLINIFEPVPLYFVLGKKGIKHWSEYKNSIWNIYFYK